MRLDLFCLFLHLNYHLEVLGQCIVELDRINKVHDLYPKQNIEIFPLFHQSLIEENNVENVRGFAKELVKAIDLGSPSES